ncbi:MAG: flagellar basal body rod protein FlgB [Planctomycetota bacterium]
MTQLLGWMFEKGATPVLEHSMKFAESRHRAILSNIANADTPGYRRVDLDPKRFRQQLDRALVERERVHPAQFVLRNDLRLPRDRAGQYRPSDWIPHDPNEGPLRHDENNVSLEREMAQLAQNTGGYSRAAALLRKSYQQIRAAITERAAEG